MSNSDRHNNYPLPIILVGGANGRLKGGSHIVPPEKYTGVANLHLTVLDLPWASPQEKFSNSTGMLGGVKVTRIFSPGASAHRDRRTSGRWQQAAGLALPAGARPTVRRSSTAN